MMLKRQIARGQVDKVVERYYLNFSILICHIAKYYNTPNARKKALAKLASFKGKTMALKWLKEKIAELKS